MRAALLLIAVFEVWMWSAAVVQPLDDDDIPLPFLVDAEPDAVCAAAVHYQPPPPAAAAASAEVGAATSPSIRINDTSYRPGQPLRGLSQKSSLCLFARQIKLGKPNRSCYGGGLASGSVAGRVDKVELRRARLVLRWVTGTSFW